LPGTSLRKKRKEKYQHIYEKQLSVNLTKEGQAPFETKRLTRLDRDLTNDPSLFSDWSLRSGCHVNLRNPHPVPDGVCKTLADPCADNEVELVEAELFDFGRSVTGNVKGRGGVE
jgi:hypothetical protein